MSGLMVDGTGTRRRLQALQAAGWSAPELGRRAGNKSRGWVRETANQPVVHRDTAAFVAELYDQLWDVPPPQTTAEQRAAFCRAKTAAWKNRWVPPAGWDDDDIDNPDAGPAMKPIRPGSPPQLRTAEYIAGEYDHLVKYGYLPEVIADRIGVTLDGLQAALRRAA